MTVTESHITGSFLSGEGLPANVVRFARFLRVNDIPVTLSSVLDAITSLRLVDVSNLELFKNLLRCNFTTGKGEMALFNALFERFWLSQAADSSQSISNPCAGGPPGCGEDASGAAAHVVPGGVVDDDPGAGQTDSLRYSPWALERKKSGQKIHFEESAALYRTMLRLLSRLSRLESRRWHYGSRGRSITLRGVLRKNIQFGGEPVHLIFKRKKPAKWRIVFFCDVSGSMDIYTLMAFQFIHVLKKAIPRTEIFFFSTDLTRVTSVFRAEDFSTALQKLPDLVADWGGGTRIGHCLQVFNENFGNRWLTGKTIVMFYSDGWDRGETDLLQQQMALVKRKANKVLWLNPLLGTQDYQPICRGIRAALPYTDYFLPATSLYDFRQTENILTRIIGP
jgi:uncharacterized protein with von Willebrand factor type A (vWA) domain